MLAPLVPLRRQVWPFPSRGFGPDALILGGLDRDALDFELSWPLGLALSGSTWAVWLRLGKILDKISGGDRSIDLHLPLPLRGPDFNGPDLT